MPVMLLAVDIGNSTVAVGGHDGAGWTACGWGEHHALLEPAAQLAAWSIAPGRFDVAALAGTVPARLGPWADACAAVVGEVWTITAATPLPLPVRYATPHTLGVDRRLAALAARSRHGAPVLVADFGTATTLDVVDADGAFVGGAILPGLAISRDALDRRTAQLPTVPLEPPAQIIGPSTLGCLQAGLVLGQVGAVAWLAERMRTEAGLPAAPLIATGGLAPILAAAAPGLFHAVEGDLIWEGMRLGWQAHVADRSAKAPDRLEDGP